jgi:hypothetical protein
LAEVIKIERIERNLDELSNEENSSGSTNEFMN